MLKIVVCAQNAMIHAGLAAMVASPTTQIVGRPNGLSALSQWLQTMTADLVIIDLAAIDPDEMSELVRIIEAPSSEKEISFLLMLDSEFAEEEPVT